MSPVVRKSGGAGGATASAPSRKAAFQPRPGAPAKKAPSKSLVEGKRVPGSRKIVNELLPGFSRQLGAMLSAGMPIVAALEALEEQADNPNFKFIVRNVRLRIENGASLSEGLRAYPSVFDNLYVNMVKGGETGGQIAETVGRLAGFLEANARLRRKVKSAMMYPIIVLCIAMAIATLMILFIVPVFGEMFADFGAELPGPTQFLLNFSARVRQFGIYILIVIIGLVIAFKKWKQTDQGAYSFDSFVLKIPVFGELARKVASARFARTLGELIRGGVPILSALEIVAGATGNRVTGAIVLRLRKSVEVGDPLSTAMSQQTVFPVMLVRMLQAGEKTGKIDEMMESIAEFYDDEVETMLSGLTSLLEPLLMVFLGVIIGGLVLCMFLPIFKMGEIVSG